MQLQVPFILFLILAAGCATQEIITGLQPTAEDNIQYSIIYIIHADGDYLYFNKNGEPRRGDRKVLAEARKVGEGAENGEVFIFHQLPEKNFLWIFPKKNRQMIHFRNGELIQSRKYSPRFEPSVFAAEADFYQRYSAGYSRDRLQRYLLYFGHELPLTKGDRYYQSMPGVEINIQKFAMAMDQFLPSDTHKFDLTVLSTCDNGSPPVVRKLRSRTGLLLASPENLHLSHFDTRRFSLLNKNVEMSAEKLARSIAEDSFERLAGNLQTAVTISLYDTDRVGNHITALDSIYQAYVGITELPEVYEDNTDCSDYSFFTDFDEGAGVEVWYRSPAFGRDAGRKTHSGWGCHIPDF